MKKTSLLIKKLFPTKAPFSKKRYLMVMLVLTAVVSGCANNQERSVRWRNYVTPLDGGAYLTNVQSRDRNKATNLANEVIWATCDHFSKQPVVIDRTVNRSGLLTENAADIHDTVRSVARATGNWIPSVNDEEYTAAFKFRCS